MATGQQTTAAPSTEGGGHSPVGMGSSNTQRGLDSGLAKAAPTAEGLNQKTYRSYRRRLVLFSKQCARRGRNTSIEGAFLCLSLLQDTAWDATEQLDIDTIESSSDPFSPMLKLLDRLYQYENDVELPGRCEEFFQEFSRLKGEELQAYLIRHATMHKKMSEVGVALPDLLAGWHLITRAGIPKWTHIQVKSLCGGELQYQRVAQALMKMFGGDHKPNVRDLFRAGTSEANFVDDEGADVFYEEADGYGQYEADFYEHDGYYDDDFSGYDGDAYFADGDVPEDLEQATEEMDDAYMNYVESRRRMKEIALSRGFFPVVAVAPPEWQASSPHFGGKSGNKGRGKGKGKGGGRSKGSGKGGGKDGFRRYAFNRVPASGLRRSAASNQAPSNNSGDQLKSTGSGSTSAHGPRFKRYRLQDAPSKPVDDANMVDDIADLNTRDVSDSAELEIHVSAINAAEEVYFNEVAPGHAIVDSGATRTVVGDRVWEQWLQLLGRAGRQNEVEVRKQVRDFRFGDGSTLRSSLEVTFPVVVSGLAKRVTASIIPGCYPYASCQACLRGVASPSGLCFWTATARWADRVVDACQNAQWPLFAQLSP